MSPRPHRRRLAASLDVEAHDTGADTQRPTEVVEAALTARLGSRPYDALL